MKCQRCWKESDMGHGDISPCEPSVSKPWEQEWKRNGLGHIEATDAIQVEVKTAFWRVPEGEAEAFRQVEEMQQFLLAAPDMARAGLAVVNDVVANFAPNVGPMTADDIIDTGLETVEIPMRQFAAMVAALRKAGAL